MKRDTITQRKSVKVPPSSKIKTAKPESRSRRQKNNGGIFLTIAGILVVALGALGYLFLQSDYARDHRFHDEPVDNDLVSHEKPKDVEIPSVEEDIIPDKDLVDVVQIPEEEPAEPSSSGLLKLANSESHALNDPASAEELSMLKLPQGTPRIVHTKYATDIVPVVSYVVTEYPYNADNTGQRDCTEAFQKALDDAHEKPGTVFVPAGYYRFDGNLTIQPGITLRGEWKKPTDKDCSVDGTVLLVYSGHGMTDGEPFIYLEGGSLRDLNIFYPRQSADSVVNYPLTVDVAGGGLVKNVTFVNPYFAMMSRSLTSIYNVYMSPLNLGIQAIRAGAVPRVFDIKMSPRYWEGSGLKGAPDRSSLLNALEVEKARGIQIHRQDGGIYVNVDIEDYPTAVKFMPPHGWTYWYNLKTRNVGVGIHYAGGSETNASIAASSISARDYAILMEMDKTGWEGQEQHWRNLSKNPRPFGTKDDICRIDLLETSLDSQGTIVYLDDSMHCRFNAQNCDFTGWGEGPDDFAIKSVSNHPKGNIMIYDSSFRGRDRHIEVANQNRFEMPEIHIKGNNFPGRPDVRIEPNERVDVDHSPYRRLPVIDYTYHRVPDTGPAKKDVRSLFVVTAPNDGKGDATRQIQEALRQAGLNGGGTVYLPYGSYRVTDHLMVPAGVELRGVNDIMPRQYQIRTLILVDIPGDAGKPRNPAFISLGSDPVRGGSGVTGLCLLYKDQNYKEFIPYPWTIRGLGPGCWVRRVNLGNVYNGIEFASNNSDKHVIYRVTGSALNIAFGVGHTPTMGWIDSCQIRPQDWSIYSSSEKLNVPIFGTHPSGDDIKKHVEYSLTPSLRGAGVITVGSEANEQVFGMFSNGGSRFIDFIDQKGTGGGNARVMVGGSECGWGSDVKALGRKGVSFIGFSFNPETRLPGVLEERIPEHQFPKGMIMKVHESVSKDTPIHFVGGHFYSRAEIGLCFDIQGSDFFMLQTYQAPWNSNSFKISRGVLTTRNTSLSKVTTSGNGVFHDH